MFSVDIPTASDEYTTSRVKKWYKVNVQGYEVVDEREVPKANSKGGVTYECRWYLRQPS